MTIDVRARVAYVLARTRFRLRRRGGRGAPVVVFSMAKTGSSAIAAGLRAAGVSPVHQIHDLDPAFLQREEAEYRWSGRPWRVWDAQSLRRHGPTEDAPWRVVSLVRDPIAQMRAMYEHLGLGEFEMVAPRVSEYLASVAGYQTNRFDLTPELRMQITQRWGEVIRRYGYPEQ